MSIRPLACVLVALGVVACRGGDARGSAVPAGTSSLHCVNPASGYAWTVRIDEAQGRIDGQPAQVGPLQLRWRDPSDGAIYELDRRSGELSVIRASSTGGYILTDRCRP
jgi:hypothetical protein